MKKTIKLTLCTDDHIGCFINICDYCSTQLFDLFFEKIYSLGETTDQCNRITIERNLGIIINSERTSSNEREMKNPFLLFHFRCFIGQFRFSINLHKNSISFCILIIFTKKSMLKSFSL